MGVISSESDAPRPAVPSSECEVPSLKKRRVGAARTYFTEKGCCLEDLQVLASKVVDVDELQFASGVQKKVVLYNCKALEASLACESSKGELMAEWAWVLSEGPGVFVLQDAFDNDAVIDACSAAFAQIVAEERAVKGSGGGDHFAKAGANDRIWNAMEKLCVRNPAIFAEYYGNQWIAAAAEAWLGPMYQVTSQTNTIRPGGKAQNMHRDYHLGFQNMDTVAKFPLHVQAGISPLLTLQGAVAHVDMPIESGTTKLLPFSHQYPQGYLAWKRKDFVTFFEDNFVQLSLKKGDLLFFNPALFHAGGENVTGSSGTGGIDRVANLLQISSAFGRAMETLDRSRMSKALYSVLLNLRAQSSNEDGQLRAEAERLEDCAIAACAEGYQFPTNLDLDVPLGAVAPLSQAALFKQSLEKGLQPEDFCQRLDLQASLKRSV
ncbi:unnamed protein product [Polarella glacialis]|uniref:Uncharacterized protein n=1 Tax=Polarella glacialis TaxID=89957 RepID=A0A813HX19_POLGL|nr:unnamed protein product [Polarella glacialis]